MEVTRDLQLKAHVSRVCLNQAKSAQIHRPIVHVENSNFTDQRFLTTSHDGISILLPGNRSPPVFVSFEWLLNKLPVRQVNISGVDYVVKTDVPVGTMLRAGVADTPVRQQPPINSYQNMVGTAIEDDLEDLEDEICQREVPPVPPPRKRRNTRKSPLIPRSDPDSQDQSKGGKRKRPYKPRKAAASANLQVSPTVVNEPSQVAAASANLQLSPTVVNAPSPVADIAPESTTELIDMPCSQDTFEAITSDLQATNGMDLLQDVISQAGIASVM